MSNVFVYIVQIIRYFSEYILCSTEESFSSLHCHIIHQRAFFPKSVTWEFHFWDEAQMLPWKEVVCVGNGQQGDSLGFGTELKCIVKEMKLFLKQRKSTTFLWHWMANKQPDHNNETPAVLLSQTGFLHLPPHSRSSPHFCPWGHAAVWMPNVELATALNNSLCVLGKYCNDPKACELPTGDITDLLGSPGLQFTINNIYFF